MDAEPYLTVLDGPSVSGRELRHEPGFQEIERLLEGATRAARTDENGQPSLTSNVDWDAILSTARELAENGRDLRLLVKVCRAWTNQNGFAGIAAGLNLLTKSLDQYWDSIFPELRDSTNPANATLRRKNAIQQIENDDDGLLGDAEMMVVLDMRGLGPIRGSELAYASMSEFDFLNEAPSGLGAAETAELKERFSTISTRAKTACRAFAEEERNRAEAELAATQSANAARAALEKTFSDKAGLQNGLGLRLGALEKFLSRCEASLKAGLDAAGDGSANTTEAPATMPTEQTAVSAATSQTATVPTGVNSRRDVERCLDMIIDFYERTEPSSPIPHLARRMRRMVPMDFLQLMEEIAPSGMKEFKNIAGVDDKRKNE